MARVEWERVESEGHQYEGHLLSDVYRACVPGGWLVLVDQGHEVTGVTFLPDPEHEWD